jgi:DNA-binding beta-propeller fold protein YncE
MVLSFRSGATGAVRPSGRDPLRMRTLPLRRSTVSRTLLLLPCCVALLLASLARVANAQINIPGLFESGVIPIGQDQEAGPLAVSADGAEVYAPTGGPQVKDSKGRLLVLDPRAKRITRTIDLDEPGFPTDIAVTPDGRFALLLITIASGIITNGRNRVEVVEIATKEITATIPLTEYPAAACQIVVNGDGTMAYVSDRGGGTLIAVSLLSNMVVDTIPVGGADNLWGIDIAGDGKRVYGGLRKTGDVAVIDTDAASATYHQVLETIPVDFLRPRKCTGVTTRSWPLAGTAHASI